MTPIPWRDRPDSALRGFILGSSHGGWAGMVFCIGLAIGTSSGFALLMAALYAVIGALATYMWYHG